MLVKSVDTQSRKLSERGLWCRRMPPSIHYLVSWRREHIYDVLLVDAVRLEATTNRSDLCCNRRRVARAPLAAGEVGKLDWRTTLAD